MSKLYSEDFQKRLSKLKILILDVDGVMTDGTVFWNGQGWSRRFCIRDGYGIRTLVREGFKLGVLSGGKSEDVAERMKFLGIHHVFLGNEEKLGGFKQILDREKLSSEETAYIGDELFDLPVLEAAGVSATVPHAPKVLKDRVDFITQNSGGDGAVRDFIDAIRFAQKIGPFPERPF